jgi:erythronate-4-phosphate dehydrogenase
MKILVDENIPLARELFGSLGEAVLVKGREVDERFPGLETFDMLAIRSVTNVTPAVVDRAANCRIIGTATIGTDHIDTAYIEQANRRRKRPITVLWAPGSNADSVADYIWCALLHLTRDDPRPLSSRSLAIIGHGNCGCRVARRAEGFGIKVLRYDPPLAERDASFVSDAFEEAIAADFVTLHVPLTRKGESPYPTHHMIGAGELAMMRPGACLLNSSRGAVVDSAALVRALEEGKLGAVLDVYEGEPQPREELIRLPVLATPHIAGYAIEAKRRGATVIYEQACRLLGTEPQDTVPLLTRGSAPPSGVRVEFTARESPEAAADDAVRQLARVACRIEDTSRELKATLVREGRGQLFDRMRRDYDKDCGRHELAVYRVAIDAAVEAGLREQIARRLRGFGIAAVESDAHFVLVQRRPLPQGSPISRTSLAPTTGRGRDG